MTEAPARAVFGAEFLRRLSALAGLYWRTPEAARSAALLAGAVVLELATVYGSFELAAAQRGIFDALQSKQLDAFFAGIGLFVAAVTGFVLASTYRIYLRQLVEIRWRRWLTGWFLAEWIAPHACCQMELQRIPADNPDQRIAEDVRNFVASALGLSLSLLAALTTLVSFAGLLWSLSGNWPLRIAGAELQIPGLMLWVAFVYSAIAIAFTHRAGRRLIPINFERLRFEADFRFALVRFRERAGAVALSRGEAREKDRADGHFARIAQNWRELIRAQRNLTLLTTSIGQANGAIPLLLAAPGYFLGRLSLGSVAQAGIAYAQVSGALTWIVNAYQELAQWRASIERLFTLEDSILDTRARMAHAGIRVETGEDAVLRLRDLSLSLPDGRALLAHATAEIAQGERVAIVGPSGAGQTTLFRAILGHWPFGSGSIELPAGAQVEFLSDRPFLPIASLRESVSYPEPESSYSDSAIGEALRAVGLAGHALRLDEVDHWEKRLSGGEQQRLALARVLLHEPSWILLDDATGALDEQAEHNMYALLADRLPRSAVVSIAHRPSVARHHERQWRLVPVDGAGSRLEVGG